MLPEERDKQKTRMLGKLEKEKKRINGKMMEKGMPMKI
jgi:hypothetical protein